MVSCPATLTQCIRTLMTSEACKCITSSSKLHSWWIPEKRVNATYQSCRETRARKVREVCLRKQASDGFEHNTPSVSSLFGFNFPQWCNTGRRRSGRKKKQKTESSKASGSFFVMSPSRQCVCMHISDPGRDRHKDEYIQHTHTQMYRHTLRERISSQDH